MAKREKQKRYSLEFREMAVRLCLPKISHAHVGTSWPSTRVQIPLLGWGKSGFVNQFKKPKVPLGERWPQLQIRADFHVLGGSRNFPLFQAARRS